jgi:hypothetical protein
MVTNCIPKQCTKIPFSDIKVLWRTDVYDGIIAGVCRYNGKTYWIDCWDFDYGGWSTSTEEEQKIVLDIIKNPTNTATIKDVDGIKIIQYNNLTYYYDSEDDEDKRMSVCRPREFYLYKLSTKQVFKEYLCHAIYKILVPGPKIFNLMHLADFYYNYISLHRFMHRKNTNKYRKERTKYHKNEIIGWTEN